jgi:anti-sigma-K factor RskA
MSQPADIHTLAGAYALDALDDIERASFARHLAACPTCAREVDEMAETVARLAGEVAEPPPPGLRSRVLAALASTPQESQAPATGRTHTPLERPGPATGPARTAEPRRTRTARRWRPWIAGTIAASVLAAGAATTTYVVQERRVHQAEQIQAVVTAPDAVTRSGPARGGDQVTAIVSLHQDAAVVLLATLAAPDRAHAYQLWFIEGSQATSAGVLPAGRNDGASYVSGIGGAQQLGVTLEPAGGSTRPSPPIIATVPLR